MSFNKHQHFMDRAINLAKDCAKIGEVPVGAVIVLNDEIIGSGANMRETRNDPIAHAEILAIQQASQYLGSWRLEDTTIYVTLEPCPMCAGAIINARIPTLVYGCDDPKAGAARSLYQLLQDPRLNHRAEVISGICADKASLLLSSFFRELRKK